MSMDDYDKMMKELKRATDYTVAAVKGQMLIMSSDIDAIIRSKEQSPSKIENLLDTLLSTMHLGLGEQEFLKLNKYYATFNKDNAA